MGWWRGIMNWPLDKGWKCEVCGGNVLIWGLQHARCRCNQCHAEYMMRDTDKNVVTTPVWQCKEEYREAIKKGWSELKKPISEWTDQELNSFMEG